MRLHLVTGHKGQAHVTAEDHGAFNAGIIGDLEAILNIGEKFRASAIDANTVRIYDGELIMQGRHVRIARDEYEDVEIDNGTQGMKRNDLIVVRYTKDTGVETAEFAVLKGTETTSTPVDPIPTTGDILSETCLLHEMPLYRVKLNGINVESVELLAETTSSLEEYKESVKKQLETKVSYDGDLFSLAEEGNGWHLRYFRALRMVYFSATINPHNTLESFTVVNSLTGEFAKLRPIDDTALATNDYRYDALVSKDGNIYMRDNAGLIQKPDGIMVSGWWITTQ